MQIRSNTTAALQTAEALLEESRPQDAIALLNAANRRHRNAKIEQELVQLRCSAGSKKNRSSPEMAWPPEVDDLFPGVLGPPEISSRELSVDVLRSGILRHGCLLVRGLIGPKRVKRLKNDVDRAFASYDSADARSLASAAPHMTRDRHAIEAWFAAPSAYPDEQVPITY